MYVKGKKVKTLNKKVTSNKKVTVTAKWKKVTVNAATIKSAKNASSKAITVKYAKVSGAKGYEIAYSTSKKFTKKTTVKVTTTKTSKKITKLKKGKTYYVKVRAYKLDSAGSKVYGKYSKALKVKIKK